MRAASLTIWSKAGWMKSANWISATGMSPLSAAPIATPTIEDSARGVSSTRACPYLACRPSVARNTPPFLPTSSPSTHTRSSRSISSASASRTPSISVLTAMSILPTSALPLGGGGGREDVEPQVRGVGLGRRLRGPDRLVDLFRALLLDGLVVGVGEQVLVHQVVPEPLDGVAPEQRLQLLLRPVAALVVVRGVGGEPGHLGVDQRGAAAGAGPIDRLPHGPVHGQEVAAVHGRAGHAV